MGNVTTIFCYEATCDCIKTNESRVTCDCILSKESGNMSSKSKELWHVPDDIVTHLTLCLVDMQSHVTTFTLDDIVTCLTLCLVDMQSHVTTFTLLDIVKCNNPLLRWHTHFTTLSLDKIGTCHNPFDLDDMFPLSLDNMQSHVTLLSLVLMQSHVAS
jgi:hypothetical protein